MKTPVTSALTGRSPRGAPRHCMVVHAYYPLGETRVQREAEALADAGFDVVVVCLRDEGEAPSEVVNGVRVLRLPIRIAKDSLARQFGSYVDMLVRSGAQVLRLHRARPFRTVQVHNLPDFLVFAGIGPKLTGTPVILDLHDLMPEFFAGRFGTDHGALGRAVALQERLSCRFADHVITVSDHWRQTLIERGVPGERISVVMNVADDRVFVRPTDTPPHEGFRLLYHGTVTRRYGLDLALEAIAAAREEVEGLHLTIVGKGDDMEALQGLRHTLRVEREVTLRDELLPVEDLPALIAGADAGIVPYRDDVFTDGLLPTKLMEYAQMGLPAIAARTTAIEHTFADTNVLFFRPGDARDLARRIVELARTTALREDLSEGAARFSDRANWTEIGAAYVELIRRLGGVSGPSSSREPAGGQAGEQASLSRLAGS